MHMRAVAAFSLVLLSILDPGFSGPRLWLERLQKVTEVAG